MTQQVSLIPALAEAHEGSDRQAELDGMDYEDYLLTPEWAAIRKRKLASVGYQCQGCKAAGRLDCHHECYPRRGTETNKDLKALCRGCHREIHGVKE